MNAIAPTAAPVVALAPAHALPDPRKPVTLWELLVWTYQVQRAGRLGLGRHHASRVRWMAYLSSLDDDGARPEIHVDAAAVHRVVCGILSTDVARLVVEAATAGLEPEPCTTSPYPYPMPNTGRGGGAHEMRGEWVECPPVRLTVADRERLKEAGRGEVERAAVPGGALRWKYRVDLRAARRIRKARFTQTAGRVRDTSVGHARGDQVWSPWCPLEWRPDPSYVAMANAIHDTFRRAMWQMEEALGDVPFRAHHLVPNA